ASCRWTPARAAASPSPADPAPDHLHPRFDLRTPRGVGPRELHDGLPAPAPAEGEPGVGRWLQAGRFHEIERHRGKPLGDLQPKLDDRAAPRSPDPLDLI